MSRIASAVVLNNRYPSDIRLLGDESGHLGAEHLTESIVGVIWMHAIAFRDPLCLQLFLIVSCRVGCGLIGTRDTRYRCSDWDVCNPAGKT
ncbi:hypothetical protein CA13_01530 [Planctomycetes bacterium CA13]|uniref:Uncharacterized protein n=1 Tax=Novipirellula herctigrandis TaxID=2527986 RepID=A0A5C5YVH1_9BACT|nr:hypothetical protein CA13_01530 [Planctomycetes bacterium CA13]